MNFIKTMVIFAVASLLLAGGASASSLSTTASSNRHSISQQMANVISENSQAADQQFTK